MKCCLFWGSKWVSDFPFAIISGFRASGECLVVTFHYSANTLAHSGEYATCYEIKLHVLLIGTIDR